MQRKARMQAIYLAVSVLLAATLACNLSNPRGPAEPTPQASTIVATATEPGPAEAPDESSNTEATPVMPTPPTPSSPGDGSSAEGGTPKSSGSSGSGGDDTSTTIDGDIFTSVSIKDGNASFEGKISYPGSNDNNNIYVKPIGFDSTKIEGNLIFSLTCSGRGKAKVNYKGGAIRSGSPGCGETWTVYVINGSPDSQITIRLDASGDVNWALTVTSSE